MFGSLIPRTERELFPLGGRFSEVLNRMEDRIEDSMERLVGGDSGWLRPVEGFIPRINLTETETELEVTAELPGLKPEDVTVELKGHDLWISGKTQQEKEEKGKTFHRVERRHGEFRRVLALPSTVDESKIDAKFEGGVLKVTMPKTETAKPRHIEVKG